VEERVQPKKAEPAAEEPASSKAVSRLQLILSGEALIALNLDFLVRSNKTDNLILTQMKKSADQRNSLSHSAIVLAHSLMNAGTTADSFLRDNLEWLSRATNWAKFSATATLGVIHRGHVKQALSLLAPYLPQAGMSASPYSEGGALFALGIIHANHGLSIRSYLLDALRNAGTNEVVQHGCALGIGIAMMGSQDADLYEELKGVLFNDSAVAGEAAALAMGLVMLGSASPKAVEEMLGYAHDTAHEKIIRGLAVGIALCMYGREEEADSLVTSLLHEQDPILRYGAMYTIAFAYACTGSNSALRSCLHVAVSDVSDDVRRAAVIAIGFVLANAPAQCPRVVKLLAESYNPHVRYGSAFAVGISCAGSGSKEALDLLTPMLADPIDYVRQGALLASSMVLMQNSDHKPDSRQAKHREDLKKVVGDKHEDTMTKFGAIVATGLLDAGGRNVTIALTSRTGNKIMPAIVGMGVFSHFWFWHPLTLFVSLAFTPTAAIGLNADLRMPQWRFKSAAPPSAFAYPPPVTNDKKEVASTVATASLSTTAKAAKVDKAKKAEAAAAEAAKAALRAEEERAAKEKAELEARDAMLSSLSELHKRGSVTGALKAALAKEATGDAMETDVKPELGELVGSVKAAHARGDMSTAAMATLLKHAGKAGEAETEPDFEVLENPSRVLRTQERHCGLLPGSRYEPIAKGRTSGVIMLKDMSPDTAEELLPLPAALAAAAVVVDDEEEPAPPEPFTLPEE
jgi:26S proteasome regulatory subunit N2